MNRLMIILLFITMPLSAKDQDNNYFSADTSNSFFENIMGSIGVVGFRNEEIIMDTIEYITIYDFDGSIYAQLSFDGYFKIMGDKYNLSYIEDKKIKLGLEYGFKPKEFFPISGAIIQFECKQILENYYEIFIDKENNITKLLKKDTVNFKYESWKEHLYKCYITFNPKENPLFTEPNGEQVNLNNILEYNFKISKICDNWIEIYSVSCYDEVESKNIKYIKGWVKWIYGKEQLIKLYYECSRGWKEHFFKSR